MLRDGTITLSDGRSLGFAEWGDANGEALFLFHGTPGSRLLCPDNDLTTDHQIRLVVTDRPGYGNSDPKPGRWLTDWPQDVCELADHLDVERFAVLGWSGGSPHALACAALVADRVTAVGMVAPNGPTDELGLMDDPQRGAVYTGAQNDRIATENAIAEFYEAVDGNDGARFVQMVHDQFPHDPVFARDDWSKNFKDHAIEGMRPGGLGRAEDSLAVAGPWGFKLSDIQSPVHVFYAGQDSLATTERSEALIAALPDARPVFWPDGTHACIYPHWSEILSTLRSDV